jgi:hypothetical protein
MQDLIPSNPNDPERTTRKVRPAGPVKKKSSAKRKRRAENKPPDHGSIVSKEDCMVALSRLPGLLTMGFISTTQANSMRGVYATLLRNLQQDKSARSNQQLDNDSVVDMLRRDPKILSLLEPLLTREQVEMVMHDGMDTDDGQT